MSGMIAAPEEDSISTIDASIVHDFRSPLAAIHASAEMLIRSGLSEPQIRRIARNMYEASVRMQELLEECLERCAGAERGPEPTEVRTLVTMAAGEMADRAGSQSVEIVQDVPRGLEVGADRQRIHRVLVNLLVNALDCMPEGGLIHMSAVSEPDAVVFRVRDTGPGIAPEIRGRLFQQFATAGKPGGRGLGLAFSRQAVVDHGGDMWAESASEGACFAFRLPAIPMRCAVSG